MVADGGGGGSFEGLFTTSQAIVFEPGLFLPRMGPAFPSLEPPLPAYAEN